jgi:hypothetical protein
MRNAPLLIEAWEDYSCPNCYVRERIRPLPPNAVRMHVCAGLKGLTAPLVLAGSDCKVIAVEREDFLNGEIQAAGDDGRPYMAIRTEYADGHNDVVVNPGVASVRFNN